MTWVCSSLAVLVVSASAVVVAASPDLLIEEMYRQDPDLAAQAMTQRSLQLLTYVTAGIVVVWALAAIVLAVLAFRRTRWARIGLLASAGGAGGLCLVASLQSVFMVVPALRVRGHVFAAPAAGCARMVRDAVIKCSHE